MNEIKIRFKSGEIGYFKLESDSIHTIFSLLGDAIKEEKSGILELIDLTDDKKTIVDIRDISTFGYNFVPI